jgi:hypothetical protein
MTKRVTVSLPDHVAARLALEPNVSAYVTEAIEAHMRGETVRGQLAAQGIHVTEEALAKWRAKLAELDAYWTPERRRALRDERWRRAREKLYGTGE